MKHFIDSKFKKCLAALPAKIQSKAEQNHRILEKNPAHPSLHFKRVKRVPHLRSVRVGANYRALGRESGPDIVWFWIGIHADYTSVIKKFAV